MKKLLSLLSLLLVAVGAWADYYTPASAYTQGDAVIYATVATNETGSTASSYEVGAFVDGVCIGHAFAETSNGKVIYTIRARGNEDLVGKTIEFRAYNELYDTEYSLTPSQAITFQLTGTYGYPTQLITLTLKALINCSLADIELEVGETVNLLDYLTMTPADATLPLNARWYIEGDMDALDFDGTNLTVTGLEIGEGSIMMDVGYDLRVEADWRVVKHATAINIVTESITVDLNDGESLSMFMRNLTDDVLGLGQAYELIPSGATDKVYWELKNDGIIEQQESNVWYPVKGGTTQIRPYFINKSGTKVYPANNKWITVTVFVPVESIRFNTSNIFANVGDDIYQRLLNHLVFTPEEPTNKNVTFSTTATDMLTISGTTAVVKAKGSGTIKVTTADGGKTATINFFFIDPLKEVTFAQNPLSLDKNTSIEDAETAIEENIIYNHNLIPEKISVEFSGVLSGSGTENDEITDENIVIISLTNTELQKGSATVTVTCGWYEFNTDDGGTLVWGTPKSFIVNIGVSLNRMIITVTPDTNDPTTGVIKLTPDPADADINWDDFPVTVRCEYLYNNEWTPVTVTSSGNGIFNYSAELPGYFRVNPVGGADPKYFQVPYKVSLASGWQWRTNPYGTVDEEANTFENLGGNKIAEVRTWADLLINDPSWGLWGTLLNTGIQQGDMYKVKMSGANVGFLYSGREDINYSYHLSEGWNWVGCPYFYNRLLTNGIGTGNLVNGVVIASKSDGSAEWNGTKWVGDLKAVKSGQGYLVYWPGGVSADYSFISFNQENNMTQGNEDSGPSGAPRHAAYISPWQYDHTQFASNMTMVATVEGITDDSRYTIGAFVNGECRGEGQFIDGLAFITVHGDGGEKVAFQLYDTYTGEFYDIDQTVTSKTRLGTLDNPVVLTSQPMVTGINVIATDSSISGEIYDANGRHLNGLQRGINIVRHADGTIRKVIVK